MADPPGDTTPLNAGEMARYAGVSASTLRNWTRRQPPLRTTTTPDGAVRFTWVQLVEFCEANAGLRGAAMVLHKRDVHRGGDPATAGTPMDVEALRAIARDMRIAAQAHLRAALAATRLAEETARSQREQLEHLATAFAAYDDALSQVTAPGTLND